MDGPQASLRTRSPPSDKEEREDGLLDTLTDAAAITASLHDPARFEVVFLRHFGAIHRYLHRRAGRELADDLAAQTFAVAFANRARFDPAQVDAGPWLYGIAGNLLRTHRRTERRQLLAYARTGIDPVAPDEVSTADERLDAAASAPRMARALAALRDDDRDALLQFAWADLTYEQIATALDVPIGTVRSRLARARRRVRELLDASGQEPGATTDPPGGER